MEGNEPEVDLGLDNVDIPMDGASEAIAELNNIGRGQPAAVARANVNATPASTAPVPKSQDPMGSMRTADLPDEVPPKATKAAAKTEAKTEAPKAEAQAALIPPPSVKEAPWFKELTFTDLADKDFLAKVPDGPVREVLERVQAELAPHFDRVHEFATLVPQLQAAKAQWDERVAKALEGDAASIKQFASDQIESYYREAQAAGIRASEADTRASEAEMRANEAVIATVRHVNPDLAETHPSFKTFQTRLAVPGLISTYAGATLPEKITALWREVAGPAAKSPETAKAEAAHMATRPKNPTEVAPTPPKQRPAPRNFEDVWAQVGEPPIDDLKRLGMGRT